MRAPGEALGLMALEIAMDEMAEKLGIDPLEFRILNDTQVDPEKLDRPFSEQQLVAARVSARSVSGGTSATRHWARPGSRRHRGAASGRWRPRACRRQDA
jgi:xanthine dehydrogenase YagR molybdenum-binding subunit